MLQPNKKAMLDYNFWLKKFGEHYYLVDMHFRNIVFEPYEITKKQFGLMKKLNGKFSILKILQEYTNSEHYGLEKFIKLLNEKGAIRYGEGVRENFYTINFEFESKCNFKCNHCYQEKYINIGNELTVQEIKQIADDLAMISVCKNSSFWRRTIHKKRIKRNM